MRSIADRILKYRKTILIGFFMLCIASVFLMTGVRINYDLSEYLPDSTPSTLALEQMRKSFGSDLPNMRVIVPDLSIAQALELKNRLGEIEGIKSVLWLDDVTDIRIPLEMVDDDIKGAWYKDGAALFSICIRGEETGNTIKSVRDLIGPRGLVSGAAVNMEETRKTTMSEVAQIALFVIPIGFIILLIATDSWLEPVLFTLTIGVAILLNEGTNFFLREVSFVTRATGAILQLAVSMDYAVFLSHRYSQSRKEHNSDIEAMKHAMVKSFPAIASSAFTTVLGFLALTLMKFKLGPDMGIVLAKGILLSYVSVMVLLPVLCVFFTGLLDKTRHRSLMPKFSGFSKTVIKICRPLAIVICLLLLPAFLAQSRNDFLFGDAGMHSEESKVMREAKAISEIFGESMQMVLLVKEGEAAREALLAEELSKIDSVKDVVSYATTVGNHIPSEFLQAGVRNSFRSGGYSRFIVEVATNNESERAFTAVEQIRAKTQELYPNQYHLISESVINYDLKTTISSDNTRVNAAAIAAIGLVLLLTFRSLCLPLLLLLTIEGAIWINMSIPYFAGSSLNFVGYQIVSAVQLGATVDYGILFSQHYLDNRLSLNKAEAVQKSLADTSGTILTTASVLFASGQVLGIVSSNGIISELGVILGRGAAISAGMVMLFLPALLITFDSFILKTTFKIGRNPFHKVLKGKERQA
ncbi:MAG: Membrane protein YdfJ [Firmicutes bacterium ADurb.Bin182]|nr:MAG: Membrane protein YdfJ [Firmicutes bacterium ADurb.Bin182]